MHLDTTAAALLLTLAFAPPAAAQDKPLAITMAYPGSIGAVWQLRERVALRSEFTLGHSKEADNVTLVEARSWKLGGTVSALMSLVRDGPRHLYVGPYYEYQRRKATYSTAVTSAIEDFGPAFVTTLVDVDARANEHSIGGVAGVEFRFEGRFSVFAEAGPAYRRSVQRADKVPTVPPDSSPLYLSDEALNLTTSKIRAIARAGVNVHF
jgi:hypothetical protein